MALATLLQVIQAETVLCDEIASVLGSVLSCLVVKDSEGVQAQLSRHDQLSASLAQAEAVRTKVYHEMCAVCHADPSIGMGGLITRVDALRRPLYASALRAFRLAIYRMRSISQQIAAYSSSQLITIESFKVEFFPELSSGTYGADGTRRSSAGSMLVNSLT